MIEGIKRERNSLNPVDLLILIALLWFNGGIIRFFSFFGTAIMLMLFAVICVLILYRDDTFISRLSKTGFIAACAYLFIISSSTLIFYQEITTEIWINIYILMIIVYSLYLSNRPKHVLKLILAVILLDRILMNIVTVIKLERNPELSRIFASGTEAVEETGEDTFLLAGFYYVYSSVIFLVYLIFNRKSVFNCSITWKILLFAYIVTTIIMLIETAYATAILVTALFVLLGLLISDKRGIKSTIIIFLTLIAVFFGAVYLLEFMAETLFSDTVVAARLEEIIHVLQGNLENASDFSDRIDRFIISLEQFFKEPFFGIYEMGEKATDLLGRHSEWIDQLAEFGLFRFALWLYFIVKSIRYALRTVKNRTAVKGACWCLFVLGVLNPIVSSELFLTFLILIPLTLVLDRSFK